MRCRTSGRQRQNVCSADHLRDNGMEQSYAVSSGIWRVEQYAGSKEVVLLKYGEMIDHWTGEKIYSFDELHEILLRKSYERRGEK